LSTNRIDAETFSQMFLAGAKRLESKKDIINELNVFPVPDGDTGTNMNLTLLSAVKEVENVTEKNMQTISKAISSGSLRGARGNSGVILSQLLRGFTKIVRDHDEIDIETFAAAMEKAVETAYKAVMKPKEGTILTVAKGAAEKALEIAGITDDFDDYFKQIICYADEVLSKTPDMLPVLKEAGVVDSGGQGLLEILKGGYAYYSGEDVDLLFANNEASNVEAVSKVIGYELTFEINRSDATNGKGIDVYSAYLDTIATDYVIKEDNGIANVWAFAQDPGKIISKALGYGSLNKVELNSCTEVPAAKEADLTVDEVTEVIEETVKEEEVSEAAKVDEANENASSEAVLTEKVEVKIPEFDIEKSVSEYEATVEEKQVEETAAPVIKKEASKEMGFIAVSVGEGLNEIFYGLGVDAVITGGQTMNPSTDDLVKAIEEVDAKTVFVLPNNKNIILAANQAQYLVEDKEIMVVPTKTIPQGITALISFMNDNSPKENFDLMTEEIKKVKTGQVTFAVRDTVINGMEIHQGNIMGIGDHDILSVGTVVEDTAAEMLEKMVDEDSELICIYYGLDVDEEIAGEFAKTIEEKFPDCDVELHPGGQPIYYYITSVE